MDSIIINGVNLNQDILESLDFLKIHINKGDKLLGIIDKVYEQAVCSDLGNSDKLDLIEKIDALRWLITNLAEDKPKEHKNIFDASRGLFGSEEHTDDTDIVGHIKNNKQYYYERIQRLSESIIYEGSEQDYHSGELFEFLRILINFQKLIKSLCAKDAE